MTKDSDQPVDYTVCPGDRNCRLKEYHIGSDYYGMRYGCAGGKQQEDEPTGKRQPPVTIWCREWRAWLCRKAYREVQRLRDLGQVPQVDPDAQGRTKRFRASFRPDRWGPAMPSRKDAA